jgi:hypothetical protein
MDKTQKNIIEGYIQYMLEHEERPASVSAFTELLAYQEPTFHKYFKSFEELEKYFWKMLFDDVVLKISEQDVYQSYSINEKLLAFYFTWIGELTAYRSYALLVARKQKIFELYPSDFGQFKDAFQDFVAGLIEEGIATEEIARRQMITDKYKYLLWMQPVSIFKFWVKDTSENFEDTDALIEKTVNFSFDLMRSNGLDSFFDLAKFHIQHI